MLLVRRSSWSGTGLGCLVPVATIRAPTGSIIEAEGEFLECCEFRPNSLFRVKSFMVSVNIHSWFTASVRTP